MPISRLRQLVRTTPTNTQLVEEITFFRERLEADHLIEGDTTPLFRVTDSLRVGKRELAARQLEGAARDFLRHYRFWQLAGRRAARHVCVQTWVGNMIGVLRSGSIDLSVPEDLWTANDRRAQEAFQVLAASLLRNGSWPPAEPTDENERLWRVVRGPIISRPRWMALAWLSAKGKLDPLPHAEPDDRVLH